MIEKFQTELLKPPKRWVASLGSIFNLNEKFHSNVFEHLKYDAPQWPWQLQHTTSLNTLIKKRYVGDVVK